MARRNALVHITDAECQGLREAAHVHQHGETQSGVLDHLAAVSLPGDPFLMADILRSLPPGSQAARAAVDIALHDLVGQKPGQPLYRLPGLNPARTPETSYTIGLGTVEEVQDMACVAAQSHFILKLKLDGNDVHRLDLVRAVRSVTDAGLVAGANCAWTEEQALRPVPALANLGLEWIEQPLPEGNLDPLRRVHQAWPLPIFADESVRTALDLPRLAGCVDGVNIKLNKAGGLREALCLIAVARAHDLQVMLSCMIETSLGITAAAHLAPLADWADLDGNLNVTSDPFSGVRIERGRLILPEGPGLGVKPRAALDAEIDG